MSSSALVVDADKQQAVARLADEERRRAEQRARAELAVQMQREFEEARAAGPEAAVAPPGAGLIAGLVVGALLLLLAAVAAGIVVSRRRRRRPGKSPDADGLAVSAEAI